ncbi:bifunctional UDP-sugar hydrolase/5'-nucleotidase UshA [Zophobihabitans entericus]|uniref:Bifunctional UDP-sugar hydrolase/5'-nucleotidase n=1 Tax=Zophobihabitans entericus TaxID=1635327 RepID=A0A6G9IDZ9_9GAMM|nr:bifunctional UDP-sugar hydrolase/5'-nucleotidase [Zophobihabitans entericus]
MKNKLKYSSVLLAALIALPTSVFAWEKDTDYNITILHTNDHHGHFWKNEFGEYGLAARKTLIDNIRQEVEKNGGSVLLLDGGDVNSGVPESDLQNAKPDFVGMDLAGYDAMAIGNHEFDKPLSVLLEQEKWVSFPLLSANIYQKSTGQRLFKPYTIFDKQGIKIAIIGLTTDDTPRIGNPKFFDDIAFTDPKIEAQATIYELKNNYQPDIIIGLTHMGHYDDGNSGSNAPGDVTLARYLEPGSMNMIIGGHSQDPVCMAEENKKQINYVPGTPCAPDRQNGTWIVQAHEWGKYLGRADFTFRNGEFTLTNYQLIPVNLKSNRTPDSADDTNDFYTQKITPNSDMLTLLTPYQEKAEEMLSEKVATVDGRLEGNRNEVRFRQTNLGRLVLTSLIDKADADLGVMSGGLIRDSIQAGDITYRDVLRIQPFGYTLAYVDIKGDKLFDYLTVAAHRKQNSGGFAQFANVGFTAHRSNETISNVTIKGEPLDLNRTYRLATISLNGGGGDGYYVVSNMDTYVDTEIVDAEIFKEYVQKHSPIRLNDYVVTGEVIYED